MNQTVTLTNLVQIGMVIMALWGFFKVVKEIVQNITARHDREKKWDEMVTNIQEERDKIYERYDKKLSEMEQTINENHADTSAKFQQIGTEMLVLTECMAAVLDGLHQQGCNGKVSEASEKLAKYMMERAHT